MDYKVLFLWVVDWMEMLRGAYCVMCEYGLRRSGPANAAIIQFIISLAGFASCLYGTAAYGKNIAIDRVIFACAIRLCFANTNARRTERAEDRVNLKTSGEFPTSRDCPRQSMRKMKLNRRFFPDTEIIPPAKNKLDKLQAPTKNQLTKPAACIY